MPGGNTRTVLYYPPFPVSLARGDGCYVEDADGHRYADFVVEQTAGIYGHSEPAIQRAISSALAQGITLGGPTPREGRLAEIMCARFPSLDMVRFTNSGTEANLMALSAARAVTGARRHTRLRGQLPRQRALLRRLWKPDERALRLGDGAPTTTWRARARSSRRTRTISPPSSSSR